MRIHVNSLPIEYEPRVKHDDEGLHLTFLAASEPETCRAVHFFLTHEEWQALVKSVEAAGTYWDNLNAQAKRIRL